MVILLWIIVKNIHEIFYDNEYVREFSHFSAQITVWAYMCVYGVCAWQYLCTWFIVRVYDWWFSPMRSPPIFFLFISLHGHSNMFDVTTSCGEIYDRWTNHTKNISNMNTFSEYGHCKCNWHVQSMLYSTFSINKLKKKWLWLQYLVHLFAFREAYLVYLI